MATAAASANTGRSSPDYTDVDIRHPSKGALRHTKEPRIALKQKTEGYQRRPGRRGKKKPRREPSKGPRQIDGPRGREKESKQMGETNNIFKGTIYVKGENELHAFQTAALVCGYCVSIFPLGGDEYRLEIFTPESVNGARYEVHR